MRQPYPAWERAGSVLSFPYGWQRPARTEEWAYERCLTNLLENRYAQMICFPWATLIDLQRKGKAGRAKLFLEALHSAPPKSTLIRATVIQHIYAKDTLPILEGLGITDLFWSHATTGETKIGSIRVHPFPLYPVCCTSVGIEEMGEWADPSERRYLYSFIGAYQPGLYLNEARRWIYELPAREDAIVEQRSDWHFEAAVYGEQINGMQQSEVALDVQRGRERQYRDVLGQSVFSLCPSGSGPNTIRLWESIGMGAIPVLFSDDLRLPTDLDGLRGIAVFLSEAKEDILELPTFLEKLMRDPMRLLERQQLMRAYWSKFLSIGYISEVSRFFGDRSLLLKLLRNK